MGPCLLRRLGGRLLSRLHAAVCAGRGRRGAADARNVRSHISAIVGALILLAALGALFVQLWVSIRERDANRVFAGDPWDGRGLEWSISAPPPEYNYAVIPRVGGRDPFFDVKRKGDPYAPPASYDEIELPKSSMTGPVIGVVGAATAFGLVWHVWWLVICGLLAIIATVIARSFARDVHKIIPVDEIERTERRWLRAAAAATPISREVEMTSANQGLAEVCG